MTDAPRPPATPPNYAYQTPAAIFPPRRPYVPPALSMQDASTATTKPSYTFEVEIGGNPFGAPS
jgi:hypothetical protein